MEENKSKIAQWLTPLWWSWYDKAALRGDIQAGMTMGIMLIPQGMAYAMLAGMPAIYGLYAAVVPPLFYAWFGSSRQLALGPAAITCIMVAAAIGGLGGLQTETPEYVQHVALLTALVGLGYFLMLLLRMEKLVHWLTPPVTQGFAAGGGIIILVNQFKYIFGVKADRTTDVFLMLQRVFSKYAEFNLPTMAVGVGAILFLYFVPKWKKQIPVALVTIIVGILVTWGLRLDKQGVSILKDVEKGLPGLVENLPGWPVALQLLPSAIIISLVGFAISISVAKIVAENRGGYTVYPRREMLAIGLSNLFSGLFSSVPVNASMSRTMVNDQAGARSGLALVFSSLLILLTLIFLTGLFYYLPKAVLGAVIIVAVIKLIKAEDAIRHYKNSKPDFIIYSITFLCVLFVGIDWGIVAGLVASFIFSKIKGGNDSPSS